MNVIFFCAKTYYCARLLDYLTQHGVEICAVVIDERYDKFSSLVRLKQRFRRNAPVHIVNAINKLTGRPKIHPQRSNNFYKKYTKTVIPVSSLNSDYCISRVQKLKPDLIVLGLVRILHKPIIAVPTHGILNAHPGLLPEYRGVEMIRWSIYNEDPVGVTIHYVERGVDTGPIIFREEIPLQKGDTIGSIKMRSIELSSHLVLKAVRIILEEGDLPVITNEVAKGSQYYRMSEDKMELVAEKLKTLTSD